MEVPWIHGSYPRYMYLATYIRCTSSSSERGTYIRAAVPALTPWTNEAPVQRRASVPLQPTQRLAIAGLLLRHGAHATLVPPCTGEAMREKQGKAGGKVTRPRGIRTPYSPYGRRRWCQWPTAARRGRGPRRENDVRGQCPSVWYLLVHVRAHGPCWPKDGIGMDHLHDPKYSH